MMRMLFAILTATFTFSLATAQAEDLTTPQGDVVLTISGNVAKTGPEGTAQFDMEMLQALPQRSFETSTIWTEAETSFVGVPLSVLLEHVGAQGTTIPGNGNQRLHSGNSGGFNLSTGPDCRL